MGNQVQVTFPTLSAHVAAAEKLYVCDLLTLTQGRVSEAAKLAGCHRVQFWRVIARHSIKPKDFAPKIDRAPTQRTWLEAGVMA